MPVAPPTAPVTGSVPMAPPDTPLTENRVPILSYQVIVCSAVSVLYLFYYQPDNWFKQLNNLMTGTIFLYSVVVVESLSVS
jgi:hypothetical protein